MRVVLPEPRKPVRMVMGIGAIVARGGPTVGFVYGGTEVERKSNETR